MANESKKICPTCGTRIKEDAERCLVCGSTLNGTKADAQVVRGGRMPEITLGLPAVIGLVVFFLAIGAGMVYLALQQTGAMADTTITPTLTQTVTLTPTTTPEPPTATPSPMPTPTPLTYVVVANDSCLANPLFSSIVSQLRAIRSMRDRNCEYRIPHQQPPPSRLLL